MNAAERVEKLFKMPQHLCNMCGKCCFVATFKGGLSHKEILDLINDPASEDSQVQGAKDFLTVFKPFDDLNEIHKKSPYFVEKVMAKLKDNEKVAFFYCKFVDKSAKCLIHEDRPVFCRMYPIPHERTIYHEKCGYEETGKKNWNEIIKILADLQNRLNTD